MKQPRILIRFTQPVYQKLHEIKAIYLAQFHKETSINKIVNSCIRHNIRIKALPPKVVHKINYRFTNPYYKKLFYQEINTQETINRLSRRFTGGLNNLNQIAHHNNALNKEEADGYMKSIPVYEQALPEISKQLDTCEKLLMKINRDVFKHEE